MARIRKYDGSSSWLLSTSWLVGRSPTCQLRLLDERVSNEHALLRWHPEGWQLEDLNSDSGTYVDGHRIAMGQRVTLLQGAMIGFGRPRGFSLVDGGPPIPHAVGIGPNLGTIEAINGLLVLPNEETPKMAIFCRGQQWWLETDDGLEPAADGMIVPTRLGPWLLHLPDPSSAAGEDSSLSLDSLSLTFTLAEDDKADGTLTVLATQGEQRLLLEPGAHNTLLLALARARLGERESPVETEGWIRLGKLLRALGLDSSQLNVEIHRSRRQLMRVAGRDAVHVIERRRGSQQLRIGVSAGALEIREGSS